MKKKRKKVDVKVYGVIHCSCGESYLTDGSEKWEDVKPKKEKKRPPTCPSTMRFIGVTFQCERKKGHKGWHWKHDEPHIRVSWAKGTGKRLRPIEELVKKFPRSVISR